MTQQSRFTAVVIGPEGSGKTVLAAVLADYVTKTRNVGLEIRATAPNTKRFFEGVMSTLRRGEWPPTTGPGDQQVLDWEWATAKMAASNEWCQVQLVDLAGQDIRAELSGKSSAHGIRGHIKSANLVILVVDIVGHQSAPDPQKQQNGWIVENVLRLMEPDIKHKSLIVVVTKADRLAHEIPESMCHVKRTVVAAIERNMPQCNLETYRSTLLNARCSVVAVAAVTAQSEYHGSRHYLVPTDQQIGMVGFVQELAAAVDRMQADAAANRERVNRWRKLAKAVGLCAVVGLAAYLVSHCARPDVDTITIKCSECGGDGIDEWWPPAEKCKTCNATGEIKVIK